MTTLLVVTLLLSLACTTLVSGATTAEQGAGEAIQLDQQSGSNAAFQVSNSTDLSYTYRLPFTRTEGVLPDWLRMRLVILTLDQNATIAVDHDADGTAENRTTLSANTTVHFSEPAAGSVVRSSVPIQVHYWYASADYGAYEDGRQAYGVPEESLLGSEYYVPLNADQLSIAATESGQIRVDRGGDGTIERSFSVQTNEVRSVENVSQGDRIVADMPIHVVAERSDWETMDNTYLVTLPSVESAQNSYDIPAEPDHSFQSPTSHSGIFLVGIRDGTEISVNKNGDGTIEQTIEVDRGTVKKVELTRAATVSANVPFLSVYSYNVTATDPWTSTTRNYNGAATLLGEIEVVQGSWGGTTQAVQMWTRFKKASSYNITEQIGTAENHSTVTSTDDEEGGIPILTRFGNGGGSLVFGLLGLIGGAGGYAVVNRLRKSELESQREDEQYD